jgi:hypothetical protein
VPAVTPSTEPDDELIVATAVLSLIHVPPGAVLASVMVAPWHTVLLPVIGPGSGVTRIVVVVWQPAAVVNRITAWPGDTPVRSPVLVFIVAIGVFRLVHVPAAVLASVMVAPMHTDDGPVIGAIGFTVTLTFALAVIPHASVTVPV